METANHVKCPLFTGLDKQAYEYALHYFQAETREFKKNVLLKNSSEPLRFFGCLLSGSVNVYLDDIDGNKMIMASVVPGNTFGESLCFLKEDTPVYIQAAEDSMVLCMKTDSLGKKDPAPLDILLCSRFTAMLAKRTLQMNTRIQILSKPSIRSKLMTFFSEYPELKKGIPVTLPMNRDDMAAYIGTNRSALSRELSCMKKEGLLDYHKSTFRFL